ncbi:MAG: hypothetical protein RL456_3536 [Pseudomonadota bacterium]|jgi:rare lipoprotein A
MGHDVKAARIARMAMTNLGVASALLLCAFSIHAASDEGAAEAVLAEIAPVTMGPIATVVPTVASMTTTVGVPEESLHQTGRASFYADKFHGRLTANGERFDNAELTMAHRTLPLGTQVRVTNLRNNESVVVRVNDRGPFSPGRIADLSRAAAEKLRMIRNGIVEVTLHIIEPVKPAHKGGRKSGG